MELTLLIIAIIAILYIAYGVIAPRPSQGRRSRYQRRGNSYNPSNNYTFFNGGGGFDGGGGGFDGGGFDGGGISELERRMRPGAMSRMGFLGFSESLEVVLAQDNQILKALHISCEQIAEALEKILQSVLDQKNKLLEENFQEWLKREGQVREGQEPFWDLQEPIFDLYKPNCIPNFSLNNLPSTDLGYFVGNKFQVFITQYRGLQECPWGCGRDNWSRLTFLILNRQSGKFVTGSGLIIHLIRKHHFFEGIQTPFRVEPAAVADVLELAPETK